NQRMANQEKHLSVIVGYVRVPKAQEAEPLRQDCIARPARKLLGNQHLASKPRLKFLANHPPTPCPPLVEESCIDGRHSDPAAGAAVPPNQSCSSSAPNGLGRQSDLSGRQRRSGNRCPGRSGES